MIYLDAEDMKRVDDLRRPDPHGRNSTAELERIVLREKLERAIAKIQDEDLRDIIETLFSLIE